MATPIAFPAFRDAVLTVYSTGRHARGTLDHVRQVLHEIEGLGVETTADLTTHTMARYVLSKGPAANPNTVNGLLAAASAVCSLAYEEGWLERLPAWRRVRLRPARAVRNRPRGYDELCGLLADLLDRRSAGWEEHRLCALTWTVAMTGLRRNEALYLQTGDLDLAAAHHAGAGGLGRLAPEDRRAAERRGRPDQDRPGPVAAPHRGPHPAEHGREGGPMKASNPRKRPRRPAAPPRGAVTDLLRRAIQARGLSAYAVARDADVDRRNVERFVKGETGLHSDTLDRICLRLGLTLADGRGGRTRARAAAADAYADADGLGG